MGSLHGQYGTVKTDHLYKKQRISNYNLTWSLAQPYHTHGTHGIYTRLATLARERVWTRVLVARGNRVVDVDQDARICRAVRSRKRDKVLGSRATTTTNLELGTREVKLCASFATSCVKRNMLVAHQVFPRSDALWDRDVVVGRT
jgi:hypothetical protein